jgi:hypothetical protein
VYVGIGDAPSIKQVLAVSPNRVDVVFNENMKSTPEILDPSRYTWSGGLSTLDVLELDGDTVKLVTTDQTTGAIYDLTINPV